MDTTKYEIAGGIKLLHSAEDFPEPAPGQLEALRSAAAQLGYELKRSYSREKLYSYILPVLQDFDGLSRLLTINTDGRTHRDFENLDFIPYLVTADDITTLEKELPEFLKRLWTLEDISAELQLTFEDSDRKANTVVLRWSGGKLLRFEEQPRRPISEADLQAHYRSLGEG